MPGLSQPPPLLAAKTQRKLPTAQCRLKPWGQEEVGLDSKAVLSEIGLDSKAVLLSAGATCNSKDPTGSLEECEGVEAWVGHNGGA